MGTPLVTIAPAHTSLISALVPPVFSLSSTPTSAPISAVNTIRNSRTGCVWGYEGPLCAVCPERYYFAAATSTCIACEGDGLRQLTALILIPLVVVLLIIYFAFATFLAKSVAKNDVVNGELGTEAMNDFLERPIVKMATMALEASVKKRGSDVVVGDDSSEQKGSVIDILRERLARTVKVMAPKMKIMVTVYQTVSSLPFVLNVRFTDLSTKLFRAFR